ncbi:hypothetical protein VNO78_09478 [Psophocarpus tetragonolobus]|uniref:Protein DETOXIFICATION n=1 Tax=Psophocarpus tetragonolobus TaxID=3891 RepID=A0AAN9SZA7_PSOTE
MDENGRLNEASKIKWKFPLLIFFRDARLVFQKDSLAKEILAIAVPTALAIAADPIASLIDTAFIGRLGPVELAAAGVSIALFNQASKITILPLVSITTSFVAEQDTVEKIRNTTVENHCTENNTVKSNEGVPLEEDIENGATKEYADTNEHMARQSEHVNPSMSKFPSFASNSEKSVSIIGRKKRNIASASTALLFGTMLGLIQTATLTFAAKPLLSLMGQKHDTPTQILAVKYLRLRALGAPAVLLFLAMQGIFRGFKDTKSPLYVIVLGFILNVALEPILIFHCKLGLNGAAISHVFSQYMMAFSLLLILMTKMVLQPPSIKDLQIFRFLKNGGMLFVKVVALTFCVTLASALAARLGPIQMAAFQTCLQVWLATSLLSDGLAVSVQAILACSFTEKHYGKVTAAATRTLHMAFVLGLGLSIFVEIGLYFGAGIFSNNVQVIHIIRIGTPFVAATQPINSLAFVLDGVNYGASDFAFSAFSMVMVSLATTASLFALYNSNGFIGIWIALSIYMSLRIFAGILRMGTGTGPWRFLRCYSLS